MIFDPFPCHKLSQILDPSHVTEMSSNIHNPFLYTWMNDNFQTEFRRVLPCLISRGRITKKQTGVSLSLYSVMETRSRGGSPCSVRRPPWPAYRKWWKWQIWRKRGTGKQWRNINKLTKWFKQKVPRSLVPAYKQHRPWRKTDKIWTKWRSSLTPTIHKSVY